MTDSDGDDVNVTADLGALIGTAARCDNAAREA